MLLFGFLELVQVYVWSADLWHVFVCTLHRVRWRVVSFKQAKYFESFLPHWICEWLNMEQKKSNLFNLIVQANLQMTMRTEKKKKTNRTDFHQCNNPLSFVMESRGFPDPTLRNLIEVRYSGELHVDHRKTTCIQTLYFILCPQDQHWPN